MSQLALQLIQQEKAAKTGYLELGRCGLTPANLLLQDVWDALSELTHLEALILSNEWYDWEQDATAYSQNKGADNLLDTIPTAIAHLVNLKKLVIAGEGFSGQWRISKIENLPPNISTLDIHYNRISKLENLPPNISTLDISLNQINHLENLPENLKELDVCGNENLELDALMPLISKGVKCYFDDNHSKIAKYLIAKEKVEKTGYLDLGNCGLTPDNPLLQDVWDALGELTDLETLILSNEWYDWEQGITTYSQNKGADNLLDTIPTAIAHLVNLKTLVIAGRHNRQWKITQIKNLPPSLSMIDIGNNQVSKLENLPQNMSKLYINNNQITKLENLPQNMSRLYIDYNQISKLENLPQSISALSINSNQISKLENLPQSMSGLIIMLNQITKLENLPQSMTMLRIGKNQITKLENLPKSMTELRIGRNQITKLENLPQSMTELHINRNQINKLENLPKSMTKLRISSNQIKDLKPLLPFIKKGIRYSTVDNPIENPPMEIMKQGNAAIIRYFEENENKDDNT